MGENSYICMCDCGIVYGAESDNLLKLNYICIYCGMHK